MKQFLLIILNFYNFKKICIVDGRVFLILDDLRACRYFIWHYHQGTNNATGAAHTEIFKL